MASKKKFEDFISSTLQGKDREKFIRQIKSNEILFPESVKRAKEAIRRPGFMEDFLKWKAGQI